MSRIAILLCASIAAFGQSFEVASIRAHPGPAHSIGITTSGSHLRAEAEFTFGLIMWAFDLKNYQIPRQPGARFDETMYDIAAKAEGEAVPTKSDFKKMMQSLLADRFKLKFHREQREMQVYALVVGKNGPKFKESAPDAETFARVGVNGRNQSFNFPRATLDDLVFNLLTFTDRPVIDRTGLTGTYAIRLEATPNFRLRNPEPDDISVFTAIQEQLGLKLEPQKARIDVLVVDHVEKPTEN